MNANEICVHTNITRVIAIAFGVNTVLTRVHTFTLDALDLCRNMQEWERERQEREKEHRFNAVNTYLTHFWIYTTWLIIYVCRLGTHVIIPLPAFLHYHARLL